MGGGLAELIRQIPWLNTCRFFFSTKSHWLNIINTTAGGAQKQKQRQGWDGMGWELDEEPEDRRQKLKSLLRIEFLDGWQSRNVEVQIRKREHK